MPARSRLAWLVTLLSVAVASDARAQTHDAASLQRDLRAWFVGLFAPALTLAEPALSVIAVGDGYDLSYPLGEAGGDTVRVHVTPLPDGRWRINQPRTPKKGVVAMGAASSDAAIAYAVGELDLRLTIDPTLGTGSAGRIEGRDITIASRSSDGDQTQRIEHYVVEGAVIPSRDGRLEVTQDATMSEWRSRTTLGGGGGVIDNDVQRVDMTLRVEGLRPDRLGVLFTSLKAAIADAMAGKPGDAGVITPTLRERLRAAVESLRGLATRVEAVETLHGFSGKLPNVGGFTVGKARVGLGGEASDDTLRAWAELGLEGLEVEGLPKEWTYLIPERVEARPVVIGVRTDRIIGLIGRALEENASEERLVKEAGELLTTDDAWIGIEALLIDLDPLRLEGSGRLRLLAPDKPGVEARIIASGLDRLMADMVRKPDMGLLVPILAMAKGLGRQEGERVVWDIALTDTQAVINGVDLLAKPTEPPQRRPSNPRR